MDQSVKAATAFLIEKTGKNPTLVETRGNGIFFQIEELNRSALNVFGDDLEYPQEQSYCLLETTNENDVGSYQETMRYDMPPYKGHGFHAEIHYTRSLFGNNPHKNHKAEIEGMLWLTTPETHEILCQDCDSSFYLRTVEHAFYEIYGISSMLSTLRHFGGKASNKAQAEGQEKLIKAVTAINRTIIRS